MLKYEIIFPPPAQLELRRSQLNEAGFLAWLSPIIILVSIYASRLSFAIVVSGNSKTLLGSPSPLQAFKRRISWIMNTTYTPEFGPLNVQLTGALYLSWLLFLIFRKTRHDYMHLTKAFGHVAISQLPLHYLLAFKSPRSPIALATGLAHERLNVYHRLFGRIVHGLLATHAILYIRFFLLINVLVKRIQNRDVILGIVAFSAFNILGLLALPGIRKKAYHNLFYRSHVIISFLVIPLLFFHVPYTRRYVLQAGVFWLGNGFYRARASEEVEVKSQALEDTQLVKVVFNVGKTSPLCDWMPGQHVYLRRGLLGPRNPFTIAQISELREQRAAEVIIVARNLSGPQTGTLGQAAKAGQIKKLFIEGPYGDAGLYMHRLLQQAQSSGRIVLIAGGVGVTYTYPIYGSLLRARGDTARLKMIWLVQTQADAQWGIDLLRKEAHMVDVEIHVTRKSPTNDVRALATQGISVFNTGSRPEMTTLIERVMIPKTDRTANSTLVASPKRGPRKVKPAYEKITFLVCGPSSLSQSVRNEVGKHVIGYGREVEWFEEQFGFGGS